MDFEVRDYVKYFNYLTLVTFNSILALVLALDQNKDCETLGLT